MASGFRPGCKNHNLIVRPMQEGCMRTRNGKAAATKLLRFFKNNRMELDARYYMIKKQGPPAKWHEPNYVKWRREKRERLTHDWNKEIENTVEMALWWRYRVQSKPGTLNYMLYQDYVKKENMKRVSKRKVSQKYPVWRVSNLERPIPKKLRIRTYQEKQYQESLQPESRLNQLKLDFESEVDDKQSAFNQWKHDTSSFKRIYANDVGRLRAHRAQRKRGMRIDGENTHQSNDSLNCILNQTNSIVDSHLIDPNYRLTQKERLFVAQPGQSQNILFNTGITPQERGRDREMSLNTQNKINKFLRRDDEQDDPPRRGASTRAAYGRSWIDQIDDDRVANVVTGQLVK